MKKTVLTALIGLSLIYLGIACAQYDDTESNSTAAENTQAPETGSVMGTVDSLTPADPASGINARITVVDDNGKMTVFEITPTTTLYDACMNPITLDAIQKDAKVKVKGASSEGSGVADSIRLVK